MIKKVKTRSQNFFFYVKERLGQIMTLRNWEERTTPKGTKLERKNKHTDCAL
jgi:hypothetical protein